MMHCQKTLALVKAEAENNHDKKYALSVHVEWLETCETENIYDEILRVKPYGIKRPLRPLSDVFTMFGNKMCHYLIW